MALREKLVQLSLMKTRFFLEKSGPGVLQREMMMIDPISGILMLLPIKAKFFTLS